ADRQRARSRPQARYLGLAKLAPETGNTQTIEGAIFGTAAYMSPEQAPSALALCSTKYWVAGEPLTAIRCSRRSTPW
ncbi:MAG TPA: hypothetical protein VMH28_09375, partial [Candidatus Acidoferrales bacterium]|nr:hypothetical protein [Candidatus Acidoferrales bacterium]